jgi:DNA-directed RNA polymerase specialized sigma24 family protein
MMPVDPYIFRQASCRASLLVASGSFRSDDWEDIKQEIVLDVLRRSPKFDPARGDWQGFVRGVARHHATVLVIRERRRAPEILSEDLMRRDDPSDANSLDILDKRPCSGVVDALHLSLDVRRVVESLPTQLQSLAVLLGQMPVQDVCRHTGKSRSRVYQMTLQIREAFVRAGLSPSGAKRPSEPVK